MRDLDTLQRTTGVAGEVDVLIEGRDLADPKVIAWMADYQRRVLKDARYSEANGCGRAALCPALSLPDLFQGDAASDRAKVTALLDAVPPYFSQAVITADRRTANLAFGIRLAPLDEQQRVIDRMRDRLDPPPGVTARIAGLPVLAAEANAALASPWRRLGTLLAGLAAVGLVLLLVFRRASRAWVPLVPIALATGWSALVLFLLRIPLNPMSATLGALVIALSTEFAVLLDGRYREERARGRAPADALRATYRSTGAAVLASGATAIAGFAVLAFSDIRMLQELGIVTVVDLSVSLLGVLAVLPAVLVLAERRAGRPRLAARAGAERSRRAGVKGGAIVVVVAALVVGYITYNSLTTEALEPIAHGTALPPFAMPLATSASGGDANVATKPGQDQLGPVPACDVRRPDVLNSCALAERGPVVLAFVVTGVGECAGQVDVMDRVARQVPGVAFAAVAEKEDRDDLRERVRTRGWTVPVGYDHDGIVGNLYGFGAVCPLLVFADARGRVVATHVGALDEAELTARARALAAGRPPS